ncbi:hypothetical protein GCM10027579_18560 [Calidifontibacter terrae]
MQGVAEAIAYVPYQLGFTPENSVVLILLEGSGLLGVIRFDPFDDPAGVARLATIVRRSRARTMTDAIVVGYGLEPQIAACVELTALTLQNSGRAAGHLVLVEEEQWCALECGCGECPSSLRPLPDIRSAPVALEAVLRGGRPAASRRDVETQAAATSAERLRARQLRALLEHPPYGGADHGAPPPSPPPSWSAIVQIVTGASPVAEVPDDVLAAATASIRTVAVRDTVLAWVAPDGFPPTLLPFGVQPLTQAASECGLSISPEGAVERLIRWANSIPEGESAPLWSIVAAHEWAAGGGAMASIAIGRALTADPDHTLAQLIARCLEHGITPTDSAG